MAPVRTDADGDMHARSVNPSLSLYGFPPAKAFAVALSVPADDADLTGFRMPSLKAKAVELGIKKDGVRGVSRICFDWMMTPMFPFLVVVLPVADKTGFLDVVLGQLKRWAECCPPAGKKGDVLAALTAVLGVHTGNGKRPLSESTNTAEDTGEPAAKKRNASQWSIAPKQVQDLVDSAAPDPPGPGQPGHEARFNEVAGCTHAAACRTAQWIDGLGNVKVDRSLQKGMLSVYVAAAMLSTGIWRVLQVYGSVSVFQLNKTIAEAFVWGAGVFDPRSNKGVSPERSALLMSPAATWPPSYDDDRGLVCSKVTARKLGGKQQAFLDDRRVKVCQLFRSHGNAAEYRFGDGNVTVSVSLDGVDREKSHHAYVSLPRCVGGDASLGDGTKPYWTTDHVYVTNLPWMQLNDRLLAGRDMELEPCIAPRSLSASQLRMAFANRLRHPKFDAAGKAMPSRRS